jgi:two-component system chemotaxis response regulator CheY
MKVRVLIADDSKVMRGIIMTTLQNSKLAEFEFTEAEDGEMALTKFNPTEIDIMFVDWNMPKLNGIDFVRKARGRPGANDTPIVMVTSEKSLGKMEVALDEAGANEYICKPFTSEDFIRKIAKFIDEISLRKQKSAGGGFFSKILGKKD